MDAKYWNDKYSASDSYIYTDVANRFVVEYCQDLPAGTMIDLAGGEGRNAVWFAERGWQAENIDFAKTALTKFLRLAEERGVSKECFAVLGEATTFESVLTPVDLGVIGYLQVPKDTLSAAIKRLTQNIKKGGTLFGVWHARENLQGGFGGPQDPAVLPTVEELKAIVAKLPLDLVVCELRDGQVQTKEGLKPSITVILKATKR
ncbi:MAG: class I SAM-dependent methyltransferase [Micrococcales bacterium]